VNFGRLDYFDFIREYHWRIAPRVENPSELLVSTDKVHCQKFGGFPILGFDESGGVEAHASCLTLEREQEVLAFE
jgi:hypothetical protein